MRINNLLSISILICATGSALAQPVYKIIGKDGKIIFSDSPPTEVGADFTVMGESNQSSKATESAKKEHTQIGSSQVHDSLRVDAKKTQAAAPISKTPSKPVVDVELERALNGIIIMEDLVQQTESLCLNALPSSFNRYNTAAVNWRNRNAAIITLQRKISSQVYDASMRRKLEAAVKLRNAKDLAPVVSADTWSKIKWCDKAFDEVNSGKMDVHNAPKLSVPVMNYRKLQQ
ncbi:MAG: hypothetical protein Q7T36_00635 [Fluviicoccus sp.]|uniref:hypothetical protein n=1 Tax=Fluviicoccus sp. TaxID=2003552 RepID=UPI00271E5B51|nr:hypothetical protein [Fluviicoccus sp.]MDO8328960.1 hypothetical protein [Fluviicoccus sp.]